MSLLSSIPERQLNAINNLLLKSVETTTQYVNQAGVGVVPVGGLSGGKEVSMRDTQMFGSGKEVPNNLESTSDVAAALLIIEFKSSSANMTRMMLVRYTRVDY
ncbi:hypothetical protein [Salinigranum marinum]|uniref:hypothetical protein n=1 Tax=Salinigranum marinum TaxID=1515595 RepID=UPI002989A949|nr:hypothetical protein [Salinigranum marinum]